MLTFIWGIVEFLIDKFADVKKSQTEGALEVKRIEAETEQSKDHWKAVILSSTGAWWFQLIFVAPLGVYWGAICLYNIFWCQDCMFAQPWTIAAFPPPLDTWAMAMISFLFLVNIDKLRGR